MPQPPELDVRTLRQDTITDAHLEALYAFFCHGMSAEEAGEILTGNRAPVDLEASKKEQAAKEAAAAKHETVFQQRMSALEGKLKHFAERAHQSMTGSMRSVSSRLSIGSAAESVAAMSPEATRRQEVLAGLLSWCKTSGDLSIGNLAWEEDDTDEAEGKSKDKTSSAEEDDESDEPLPPRGQPILSKDVPRLQREAMKQVGFLFAAYRVDCWCVLCTSLAAAACPGRAVWCLDTSARTHHR